MTREAKIGLLVALAFILVIGILLSDHVTSSTRPPLAHLSAAENIYGSMQTPGAAQLPQAQQAAGTPFHYPTEQPTPGQLDIRREHLPQQGTDVARPEVAVGDPWDARAPANPEPDPLTRAAESAGEPVIPVETRPVPPQPVSPQPQQAMAGVNEYVVQSGDVLSKIVARFMGRDTPANREAFYAMNPRLRADPNRLNVGDKLNVPASPEAARAAVAGSNAPTSTTASTRQPAQQQAAAPVQRPAPAQPGRQAEPKIYTVKKGDTLWAIAAKQLGDGNRLHDIVRLNSDQLSDPDDIQPGMKLKMPA